ncbi:hypothetical protein NEMBOFW57_008754 [Staphylotrichum longicolle]|uniref:PX-associated-domain-containing protein n=1 Tax=Staphylotrichum longicolle TaxID=669026 RepID=A0AAD4HZ70_9PEZI|nr:hypothetical protein NEMBOFW57_008754 [Staphylotrichum longicolle]
MGQQTVNDISELAASEQSPAPTSAVPEALTSAQLHALLDILTHQKTYAEVESFKDPNTISEYGYPFARHAPESTGGPCYATDSAAPLLAGVLRSIVLPFPGVRDLPAPFWHVRFQGILRKLAEAELSESYDKGVLGTRKTLATAASAIHEAVSRGILGGLAPGVNRNLHGHYDRSKAEDLVRAWEDVVQELVYGNLVEEIFACAAEKQSVEEHSPGVQAAADYIIIHLATLIHHVFVLSPEGPYLLKLLENVHRLLPYSMIKQTLRIGNAATMLNGMVRLLLAKMGVGALSNWVGLTQNADDGMNLLQRIISLVLSWDALEFRRSAEAIEKAKGSSNPSKAQLKAIKDYVSKPRNEHEATRKASLQASRSIVVTILERSNPDLLASISETQHTQCLEYLSALLAARDRDEISNAICRQSPDLFTQAIKDAVSSFEPMIRSIHQQIDLREHVSAAEGFLTEFIHISKAKKTSSGLLVEDYVLLLRNNRQLVYNWLHQLASQCPEIRADFCVWAKQTIKLFSQSSQTTPYPEPSQRPPSTTTKTPRHGAAGALSTPLQQLFTSLPHSTQSRLLPTIDAHAAYLTALETLSLTRMQHILDNLPPSTTDNTAAAAAIRTGSSTPTGPTSSSFLTTTSSSTSYFSPAYWSGRSTPLAHSRCPSPNPPPATEAERGRSFAGPGMYLARWQQLLDDTVIAPATATAAAAAASVADGAPMRKGADVKGVLARGKTGSGGAGANRDGGWERGLSEAEEPVRVDVTCVVEVLGEGFRRLVGGFMKGEGVVGVGK